MTTLRVLRLAAAVAAACAAGAAIDVGAAEPAALTVLAAKAPAPPWPPGDERGMTNTLGEATTLRCGWHLSQRGARTYEASFVRSNAMPKSPFANPSLSKPKPTAGVPFSAHAFNSEAFGLDAPFIDPVPNGLLQGKAPPAPGTEPNLPFSIHHYMLSVFGIHHLENLNLAAMAADRVWTSCAMVLPSRDKGAAGAVIRPVAIGVPGQR